VNTLIDYLATPASWLLAYPWAPAAAGAVLAAVGVAAAILHRRAG